MDKIGAGMNRYDVYAIIILSLLLFNSQELIDAFCRLILWSVK